jgi:hypothetical protein
LSSLQDSQNCPSAKEPGAVEVPQAKWHGYTLDQQASEPLSATLLAVKESYRVRFTRMVGAKLAFLAASKTCT